LGLVIFVNVPDAAEAGRMLTPAVMIRLPAASRHADRRRTVPPKSRH
jgi:hypothetical protein